jgi:hypothetical protein
MLNEQNYDYLKRQLFYTGFGDELDEQLKKKIEQGSEKFSLDYSKKFGKDEVFTTLHFGKGTKSDNYFFNSYDLTLKQPDREEVKQVVFIGEKYNYTLMERYNMLDGRAVYKDQPKLIRNEETGKMMPTGETYTAWKDLDLKNMDKIGNFVPKTMFWDHKKELRQYPIKEKETDYDFNRLVTSLEKGNKARVKILKDGQEIQGAVAANPRQQRFDFYDQNGEFIKVRKEQSIKQERTVEQAATKEPKQAEEQKQALQQTDNSRQRNSKQLRVS